ncbi:hypothetical protein F4809DRAFT_656560 [Biscogniauxia mediterranea]|nr:hypothetical protein F4809DRAFT_656560 [Biscogniauxia mediterranea]
MAFPRVPSQLLFFCLARVVGSYTVFETTCAKPTTSANFVSSPDSRGTLDILWSSLFTIIACTWTIQHPNLPEQRNGDLKSRLQSIYENAKWMVFTALAPEVIIMAAVHDLLAAMKSYQKLQEFSEKDGLEWTLTHCFYANMGGFVIRIRAKEGLEYHNPYHLTANDIHRLRKERVLQTLPSITKEEIDDKSKSDSFVKALAVTQILWTTLQIVVRAARKLSISQLELAVLAFAVCAVIIYVLYWNKPKSIRTATVIEEYDDGIPYEVLRLLNGSSTNIELIKDFFFPLINDRFESPQQGSPLSIDTLTDIGHGKLIAYLGVLSLLLFGGIHIGAWNFTFPSRAELILWRCASIFTGAFGVFMLLLGYTEIYVTLPIRLFKVAVLMSSCLYVIARLFILVELFRTLCFLPPEAFGSTWTSNIPHVA